MIVDAPVALQCSEEEMLDTLCERISIRISTGPHDNQGVPIPEVGSGLQSLLDMAINLAEAPAEGKRIIVAIEEPESFLHPAAQRSVGRQLRSLDIVNQAIVTTHSPIIVEEARFGEVVLCHNQRFYEPQGIADEKRESINTALLSGYGAEMVFASSVLFVEGEGDRQFFERLRRRLAAIDNTGRVDKLFVLPVGSNTQFAPWIRLLNSYGTPTDKPITWLVAIDGDSSQELRRALTDVGIVLPQHVAIALTHIATAHRAGILEWRQALRAFNQRAVNNGVRTLFLDIDLEYTMLGNTSQQFMDRIASHAGIGSQTRDELLRRLGSKSQGTPVNDAFKHPWLRGYIGENIAWNELTASAIEILRLWMMGVMSAPDAQEVLSRPV